MGRCWKKSKAAGKMTADMFVSWAVVKTYACGETSPGGKKQHLCHRKQETGREINVGVILRNPSTALYLWCYVVFWLGLWWDIKNNGIWYPHWFVYTHIKTCNHERLLLMPSLNQSTKPKKKSYIYVEFTLSDKGFKAITKTPETHSANRLI